jgi:hypothetical protein
VIEGTGAFNIAYGRWQVGQYIILQCKKFGPGFFDKQPGQYLTFDKSVLVGRFSNHCYKLVRSWVISHFTLQFCSSRGSKCDFGMQRCFKSFVFLAGHNIARWNFFDPLCGNFGGFLFELGPKNANIFTSVETNHSAV